MEILHNRWKVEDGNPTKAVMDVLVNELHPRNRLQIRAQANNLKKKAKRAK